MIAGAVFGWQVLKEQTVPINDEHVQFIRELKRQASRCCKVLHAWLLV